MFALKTHVLDVFHTCYIVCTKRARVGRVSRVLNLIVCVACACVGRVSHVVNCLRTFWTSCFTCLKLFALKAHVLGVFHRTCFTRLKFFELNAHVLEVFRMSSIVCDARARSGRVSHVLN